MNKRLATALGNCQTCNGEGCRSVELMACFFFSRETLGFLWGAIGIDFKGGELLKGVYRGNVPDKSRQVSGRGR